MQKLKKTKKQRQRQQQIRSQKSASRKSAAGRLEASQRQKREASQFLDLLAAKRTAQAVGLFERFDGMSDMRNALRRLSEKTEEWAGMPMPLEDHDLIIDKSYPFADVLTGITGARVAAEEDEMNGVMPRAKKDIRIRNRFWSWRWRSEILVWEEDGKVQWGPSDATGGQVSMMLQTLSASDAWGIEQESNAVNLLGTMVRHRQFKQYLTTGMFLEKSERSGVHYLFRRLRPTVAMTGNTADGTMRILAALCLHPIAYYSGSWAGAMCPTDDVVAHLALMRGDEHMLWKRSNQHPAHSRAAGI